MSELNFTNTPSTSIATPSAGVSAPFVDSDKQLKTKDDTGYVRGWNNNFSIASQAVPAASRTYITGSKITVPPGKLQVGTVFEWVLNMTKTAAGIAASTFDICVGTAGTTADTARVSFAKPAGTAAVDQATVTIRAVVRSIGATGVIVGDFTLIHNLAATGHAVIPCVCVTTVSAGFDMTVANLFVGLCLTSGAADAITIQMCTAEVSNL